MARTSGKHRRRKKVAKEGWWASLDDARRRRFVRRGLISVSALVAVVMVTTSVNLLNAHVARALLREHPLATLDLVDLPEQLATLAVEDLHRTVADLLAGDWTDDGVCREMASRMAGVGWVERVNFVRRTSDARFEVGCRYRRPFAMVQQQNEFLLVDDSGVRLPGVYLHDPAWKLIQGMSGMLPASGVPSVDPDLHGGLAILKALRDEAFGKQITAVLVGNFGGRVDRRASHMLLATDQAGGRIRWGSSPGFEVVENTVEQKLAILRENHRRTGRVDAGHPVIDISTFPDRFAIPG